MGAQKGSAIVWGQAQKRGKEGSVQPEGWKILPFQSRGGIHPNPKLPPHHAAALIIEVAGRQKSPGCNLDSFWCQAPFHYLILPKIAMKKLLLTYFVVGETDTGGNDMT